MADFIVICEAEDDIDDILAFISIDNFEASVELYGQFVDIFKMLAENPGAGRESSELEHGLRSFPIGSYLIFYRGWANRVSISRVLHGARDFDEIVS